MDVSNGGGDISLEMITNYSYLQSRRIWRPLRIQA